MAKSTNLPRLLMLAVILALIATGLYLSFFTAAGTQLRHNPKLFHADVQSWTAAHPIAAPAIVVALYILLTLSMLPVWWLQVLAGAAFGLAWGVTWSLVGATLGATLTFHVARWLAADFFHGKIESKMAKLR